MQKVETNFAVRLKELRANRTQSEMARSLGINQQTYARWEIGDRQPKLQDLCALCLHFGVTADWILGLAEKTVYTSSDKEKLFAAESNCCQYSVKEDRIKQLEVDNSRLIFIVETLTKKLNGG